MATQKRSSGNRDKSAATRSRAASAPSAASSKTTRSTQSAKPAGPASRAPKKTGTTRTAGTTRTGKANSRASAASTDGSTRARSNANRRTASSQNGAARPRQNSTRPGTGPTYDGVAESVKHAGASALRAANRASGPALTVAAAGAGIAAGIMLRQRPKPTVRDGIGARSRHVLHDIDPTSILEGLSKASIQLSRRSKSIAHDIERVADGAERLGKVLR